MHSRTLKCQHAAASYAVSCNSVNYLIQQTQLISSLPVGSYLSSQVFQHFNMKFRTLDKIGSLSVYLLICLAVIGGHYRVCSGEITLAGTITFESVSGIGNLFKPLALASVSPGWYALRSSALHCSRSDAMIGTAWDSLSTYCNGLWAEPVENSLSYKYWWKRLNPRAMAWASLLCSKYQFAMYDRHKQLASQSHLPWCAIAWLQSYLYPWANWMLCLHWNSISILRNCSADYTTGLIRMKDP